MTNGQTVAQFERAFAKAVGAEYAIGVTNGTVSIQAALHALDLQPGQPVAVPPLTMASTSIAVLNAGGVPRFTDVDPDTWTMQGTRGLLALPVSLYGLWYDHSRIDGPRIDDAAQTLRKHDPRAAFTSYSLQSSKIIATGEGGVLVTNHATLAQRVREYTSLGYRLAADQPRIDPATLKHPSYARHYSLGINARMNDATAALALSQVKKAKQLVADRRACAALYHDVVGGTPWMREQVGEPHDAWTYAVALESAVLWAPLVAAIERNGGERPYPAWLPTYLEPAFKHLASPGTCPNAERLQGTLVQFQTNKRESAERNADALAKAIREVGG